MQTQIVPKKSKEPAAYKLADIILKMPSGRCTSEQLGKKILMVSKKDSILQREMSSWVTQVRFRLESKFGCTLVYSRKTGDYKLADKGSFDASRFTMSHYRRAVLSAARAQELNDLGFLNKAHIDKLVEEVFNKASRKTKELSSLKRVLVEKWRLMKNHDKKVLTHEKA